MAATLKRAERKLKTFLSYPREQAEHARQVHQFLTSAGVDNWWDQESLVGGDDWDRVRAQAQKSADLFLLICSEETVGRSGVIQREIHEAVDAARDRRPGDLYIVNLRASQIELPPELARYQWIDLFSEGWKQKLGRSVARALDQHSLKVPDTLEVVLATSASTTPERIQIEEHDEDGDRHLTYVVYPPGNTYWDYVSSEVKSKALGGLYQSRRHQRNWTHQEGTGYWELNVTEFHRSRDLVSLVLAEHHYFSGMAHPNNSITTMNFFGERAGLIDIYELFDHNSDALKLLTDVVELDFKRQGIETAPSFIRKYADDHGWEFLSQFNVNDRGMIINFSAASGLPHAFGLPEVYVPWEWVRDFLPQAVRELLSEHGLTV